MPNEVVPQTACANCEDCPAKKDTVKDSWLWIRDAQGFGSVTVTLVTVAFWVTTFAYALSLVERVGTVTIRPFDVAACASYFSPVLAAYVTRKFTDAKFKS